MDPRREAEQIWKHMGRYQKSIGETVLYYEFDAENSTFDRVYDEAFRRWHPARRVPVMWVDQQEAVEDYASEGRRPTQRLRVAVAAKHMHEVGISVTEVHGNRLQDTSSSTIWREDRLHDVMYYDGRYYKVSAFQVRGRIKGVDVVVGITGIETFPDDDMMMDFTPGEVPA